MAHMPESSDLAPAVRDACIRKFTEWWSADDMWRILANMDWHIYAQLSDHREEIGDSEQVAEILLDMVGQRFLYSIGDGGEKRRCFLGEIMSAIDGYEREDILEEVRDSYKNVASVDDILETRVSSRWCRTLARALGLPSSVGESYLSENLPEIEVMEPHSPLNPLFDYQRTTGQYVREMLEGKEIGGSGIKRKLIAVPTGAGKTRMVVETLVQWFNHGRPSRNKQQSGSKFVLWVAQSTELCEQAFGTFRDVFESMGRRDTTMHMYRFWGTGSALPSLGMADLLEKGVIVSTINSLYKVLKKDRKQLERLGNVTSCIVIDEAHRSVSPMYSYVLEEMGFKWGRRKAEISSLGTILIGLTATPFRGRGDNEETRMLLRRYNGVYYPEIPVGSIDGNFLPHAIIDCQPAATVGAAVWILGEKSYDRDGAITRWEWSVSGSSGGGGEGTARDVQSSMEATREDGSWRAVSYDEENLAITFAKSGRYVIRLRVTDNEGGVGESSAEITVTHPAETSSDDRQKELYKRLIQRKILCKVYHHVLESPLFQRLDKSEMSYIKQFGEFQTKTIREIGYHKQRNGLILSEIYRLHRGGRKSILFFGCSIEHSRLVSSLLKIMYGIKSSYVDSKLDSGSRAHAIEGFRDGRIAVLCNYDILTAGFDAPDVDCVFVGRPIRSTLLYTQMIGRGMRGTRLGGTKDVLLVDMDDNFQTMNDERIEAGWKIFREYWEAWDDGMVKGSTKDRSPEPSTKGRESGTAGADDDPTRINGRHEPDPLLSEMTRTCTGCGVAATGAAAIRSIFDFTCDDQTLVEIYKAGGAGMPLECRICRDGSLEDAV